ncbi:transposase [Patescibacteria group bacterium]|nr:transposase [Patescibacteria group bacterium]
MARQLRIQYPGALYHITVRGNQKKEIYYSDYDRRCFLSVIERVFKARNIICHAYCLMPNHFHLVLETPEANISLCMRDINSIYTQSYHKIHNTVGHLFQGRFKSFLIEKESYLLEVIRYTVLNPVRAGLVDDPEDWRWSSYCATVGYRRPPKWLSISWILLFFSCNKRRARRDFINFVYSGIGGESPFKSIYREKILGSQQFIDSVSAIDPNIERIKEVPVTQRIIGRPTLGEIFLSIIDRGERDQAIRFAKYHCGYSVTEIARFLNVSVSLISLIAK